MAKCKLLMQTGQVQKIIDFFDGYSDDKVSCKYIKKVAFISDVGMTGPYLSSLGCDLDSVITRMRGLSSKFLISENSGQFAGVVIEFNDKHQPISIERVLINDDHLYRAS